MTRRLRFDIWTFVLIGAWAICSLLLIWPLSSILRASLIDNETGAFSLVHYVADRDHQGLSAGHRAIP